MPLIGDAQRLDVDGFNPCVFKHGDGWVMLYRRDQKGKVEPVRPDLRLAFLDSGMNPFNDQHWLSDAEDPRVFEYEDKLHCAYTNSPNDYRCGENVQMYCELTASLSPRCHVQIAYGESTEKNWGFFQARSGLCCVYGIDPHTVLELCGTGVVKQYRTLLPQRWRGGGFSGGPSPVLVEGLYYSFPHSWWKKHAFPDGTKLTRGRRFYYTSVYAFSAEAPYEVKRILPEPLLAPESEATRIRFPCGATLTDGKWLLSYGQANSQCWVMSLDHSELKNAMVDV